MSIGFSKTFAFEREILSKALREFEKNPILSRNEVMRKLGVGGQKAEATVLWLGKLGLRNNKERCLTAFGSFLLKHDPYLQHNATLWLLHYQLASNPDAEVWYLLTNKFLPNQSNFTFDSAIQFLVSKGIRTSSDKHLRADVSIFLRSFVLESALGKTEFIQTQGKAKRNIAQNIFCKNPPLDISPYLVAYAIFDQKMKRFPNLITVTIEELLTEDGNAGRVFSLTRRKLEEILRLLSSHQFGHLIDLSTTAGLDQVGLRFRGQPIEILEMGYISKF